MQVSTGWTTTQGAGSLSGRSFGRFGAAPGEKRDAHGIHSSILAGMGVGSQRPGSAPALAGHSFFYTARAQVRDGEHGQARAAVRCVTPHREGCQA